MNPYKVLGIEKDATEAEIKTAYRNSAKIHHPDVGGDEQMFQTVNLAYNVLSNPKKRKLYDDDGIIMDDSPSHLANLINSRLADLADRWLDSLLKGNKVSLSAFALGGIDQMKRNLAIANIKLEENASITDDVLKRLSCSSTESIIHNSILKRKTAYKQGIEQNKTEIGILEQIQEVIGTYSYDEEKVEEVVLHTNTTSTVGMGMRFI